MRPSLLLLLLASVPASLAKGDWMPKNYPNPVKDPRACGRSGVAHSWVCDPDLLMTPESRNVVEGIVKAIAAGEEPYAKSACGSLGDVGAQVAVAVMQSFSQQLIAATDARRVAEKFAESLHNTWGVGLAECNNGVLLLLSMEDRQVYISRGAGVARLLADGVLDKIIDGMKPALRAGRVDAAIESAVVDIGVALAGKTLPSDDEGSVFKWVCAGGFVAGFAALFAFAIRKERREQRKYDDCKAKLEQLKKDQARLREGGTFNTTSCPICLEDFDPLTGAQVPSSEQRDTTAEAGGDGPSDSPTEPLLKAHVHAADGAGSSSGAGGLPVGGAGSGSAGSGGAGGAAGGKSVGGKKEKEAPKRRPLVLPCKHQFCESCISAWVAQKKVSCPVCRKPINGTPGGDEGSTSRPPCQEGTETETEAAAAAAEQEYLQRAYRGPYQGFNDPRYRQRGYNEQDRLRDELLFRLLMLRRRYPAYIDDAMVNRWSEDVAQDRELSTSFWSVFQQNNPAVRAAMAQSGSSGSSSGFGGGRSSGGRGGSW